MGDWILSHPDWKSELPEENPEVQGDSQTQEETPVEPKKPLTEEERKERAAALQDRLEKARNKRLEEERKEAIEKEKTRRKEGQNIGSIKEDYQQKMMKKQALERKKQKAADAEAKRRVKEQIAADKARRQAEANAAKGISAVTETSAVVREKQEETKKQAPTATNTRIQLRLPDGKRLVQVFEASDDLSVLIRHAHLNTGLDESEFRLVSGGMPPKKFTESDRSKSLVDLGLVPSAVVMVQKVYKNILIENCDENYY